MVQKFRAAQTTIDGLETAFLGLTGYVMPDHDLTWSFNNDRSKGKSGTAPTPPVAPK
ncbi:MAG: hypothetical protein PHX61_07345 [Alphaproteobacteria bacterium]|nr:hypothetical protein [Alphaproteobacteria bacterium]